MYPIQIPFSHAGFPYNDFIVSGRRLTTIQVRDKQSITRKLGGTNIKLRAPHYLALNEGPADGSHLQIDGCSTAPQTQNTKDEGTLRVRFKRTNPK